MTSCPFNAFVSILEGKGFGTDVGKFVSELKDSAFIEVTGHDLTLRPHPARTGAIKRLLEDWKKRLA
jgi:hypothetical protein